MWARRWTSSNPIAAPSDQPRTIAVVRREEPPSANLGMALSTNRKNRVLRAPAATRPCDLIRQPEAERRRVKQRAGPY
jgi:hypothetical protein